MAQGNSWHASVTKDVRLGARGLKKRGNLKEELLLCIHTLASRWTWKRASRGVNWRTSKAIFLLFLPPVRFPVRRRTENKTKRPAVCSSISFFCDLLTSNALTLGLFFFIFVRVNTTTHAYASCSFKRLTPEKKRSKILNNSLSLTRFY